MGVITLQQAAQWCGGRIDPKYKDVTFLGANNDTRKLEAGQLFVALQGVRDGHDFIPAALEKGAAAVLCTRCEGDYPAIVVPDTRIALGDIARGERDRIGMKVVGITGSVGKSTTKEMVASVLQTTYRVGKTPVNHNNDIGMPMAILAMPEDTEVAVLEMGMNHFREMAYLSSVAQPDIAVIVNIGSMHIEFLGSIEGVRQAKLEILEGMDQNGMLLLNGDDAMLRNLPRKPEQSVTYFGSDEEACAVRYKNVQEQSGAIKFDVCVDNQCFPVEMALEGRHFVLDAMAAITVALKLNVSPVRIQESLSMFRNMAGRQEIYEVNGYTIISDCYNAGPESMSAALKVLGKRKGRRIAVLGDMLELGDVTWAEHFRVGRIAAENADVVYAYGPNGNRVTGGAVTGGMNPAFARHFDTHEDTAAALKRLAKPGDIYLFKGSRGMHMERILEMFLKDEK